MANNNINKWTQIASLRIEIKFKLFVHNELQISYLIFVVKYAHADFSLSQRGRCLEESLRDVVYVDPVG